MLGGDPLKRNVCLLYTCYCDLLNTWKVTVVWIECHDAVFYAISSRYTPSIVSSRKILNSVSKLANWIIVDILKYLY